MNEHPNEAVVRSAYEAVGRGDLDAFATALDDDIVWHESTPGFEGDYHGRDDAVALLGRVFETPGMEVKSLSIDHILADDSHAAVLLEVTITLRDQDRTSQFVDVYRVRGGKLTEHWHLPIDPQGEEKFFTG